MSHLCVVWCDGDTDHNLRDSQSMDIILFLDKFWGVSSPLCVEKLMVS